MTSPSRTGTILDKIVERTSADLQDRKSILSIDKLEQRISARPDAVPFESLLRASNPGVIAEFKRASPSKGLIAGDLDPVDVARDYFTGGAAAASVLTDTPFFQGTLHDMERVAEVAHSFDVPRAVLRKDFMIDPYQIAEARAAGADVILLIVAVLKGQVLRDMLQAARDYGLEVLVEIHDDAELQEALNADAQVIGINNRDLRTFDVDLATTERLAPQIPSDRTIVAESGIFTRADVERLQQAGAHAILVGESLMRSENRQQAVRDLMGAG
jgi:indole-3-glycerol phosphate synthase